MIAVNVACKHSNILIFDNLNSLYSGEPVRNVVRENLLSFSVMNESLIAVIKKILGSLFLA